MSDPKVRFKRSSVPGKIPNETQVLLGEIALNTYDGKVFASKNVGVGTTVYVVNPWSVGTGTDVYDTYFTTGNVGIGTTIPTAKLSVVGHGNFTGVVTASNFSGDGSLLTGITASAAPGGSNGQVQYNDNGSTSGATELYYDDLTGRVGIGNTNPTAKLSVTGDVNFTGIVTASGFSGNASSATYATSAGIATYADISGIATYATYATSAGIATYSTSAGIATYADTTGIATYATSAGIATALQNARTFEITGDVLGSAVSFDGTGNVSIAATIQPNSVGLGTDTTGDYVQNITGTANQITVTSGTGEGSTPTLSIPNQFTAPQDVEITRDLQVNRNLNVNGSITIGGTSATLFTSELKIYDPDIVLGFRTDAFGNDVSTDNTANHGGIAVASTEGNPLVQLFIAGIETNPATYKKIMWFKAGEFAGLGTDAWLSNYAIGIGSTQVPNGVRLAAGGMQVTDNNISSPGINISGVSTFTNGPVLVGSGTSTGTASQSLQVTGGAYVSGNLGVGITNPTAKLELYNASGSAAWRFRIGTNVSDGAGFYQRANGDFEMVIRDASNNNNYIVGSSGNISLRPTSNVLINTETPTGTSSQPLQVTGGAYVSGNLGVGVTNPGQKLDVSGNIQSTDSVRVFSSFGNRYNYIRGDSSADYGAIGARTSSDTVNTDAIVWSPSGNVGIGTTIPSYKLHVIGDINFSGSLYQNGTLFTSGGGSSQWVTTTAGINTLSNVGVGTTNPLQKLHVLGNLLVAAGSSTGQHITQKAYELNSGTLSWEGSAGQLFSITNNLTSGSIFSVNDVSGIPSIDVDANGTVELAPFGGNVGVGLTNPTSKLSVNGNVSATTFTSTSDLNLKTNIKNIDNSLDILLKLRGVTFDWKNDGNPSIGIIAQEVEEILPELVTNTNPKTVNYNGLIGILIEAMKEQQVQINTLKEEIEMLKK